MTQLAANTLHLTFTRYEAKYQIEAVLCGPRTFEKRLQPDQKSTLTQILNHQPYPPPPQKLRPTANLNALNRVAELARLMC